MGLRSLEGVFISLSHLNGILELARLQEGGAICAREMPQRHRHGPSRVPRSARDVPSQCRGDASVLEEAELLPKHGSEQPQHPATEGGSGT